MGDSVHPTRRPLRIAAARADANADRAAASFDDNELTNWSGRWIEYDLESPAAVSEVTLKVGDFRTRAYGVRVSVDGNEAFRGQTQRSLGYTTLPFPAATGKTVRIELTSASGDRDAFGGIVEVGEATAAPTTAPASNPARRGPSIVEIELYSPLK